MRCQFGHVTTWNLRSTKHAYSTVWPRRVPIKSKPMIRSVSQSAHVKGFWNRSRYLKRDWYCITDQPVPASHLAYPEGTAALHIVLATAPRVSRSSEHFLDRFDFHKYSKPRCAELRNGEMAPSIILLQRCLAHKKQPPPGNLQSHMARAIW